MSDVELLNYLKKSLGVIIKILEEKGVKVVNYNDHIFIPELEIDSNGVELEINSDFISIQVDKQSNPVKVNLDREITNSEYTVIHPGIIKVINRATGKLYLKAPYGQTSVVRIEALRRSNT